MSSPIAKKTDEINLLHKALTAFHKGVSHRRRINILSEALIMYFRDIVANMNNVRCIDVGCGDLGIMERIAEAVPGTIWEYLDIYDIPEHLIHSPKWSKYKKFNGRDLPFDDNSIDIVLFCDTLHHAGENAKHLLEQAHRIGGVVIIKDSFEYSLYSRCMLRMMDVIGNWGYGVSIPRNYFSRDSFKALCKEVGFKVKRLDIGIQLYGHLPIIRSILRPKWHFIAVLIKSSCR